MQKIKVRSTKIKKKHHRHHKYILEKRNARTLEKLKIYTTITY